MLDYRKIVEEHLGRKLKKWEVVHHKDGDQHNNNNIENLEVMPVSEHRKIKRIKSEKWEELIKEIICEKDVLDIENINNVFSFFFTSRQKQIIFRKYYGLVLSKTEREYFSRVIKKKLKALCDENINYIAKKILLVGI